jgi:hypothetical protein
MIHKHNDAKPPKTCYFRVNVNGSMQFVPMQVNEQGLLRYIGKDTDRASSSIDA